MFKYLKVKGNIEFSTETKWRGSSYGAVNEQNIIIIEIIKWWKLDKDLEMKDLNKAQQPSSNQHML